MSIESLKQQSTRFTVAYTVAYEELQNSSSALEYYHRVFSLDINFPDVTEPLRERR
jgi:predicted small integral membrane protein